MELEFRPSGIVSSTTEESPKRKPGKHYTAEQKLAVLRRHPSGKIPISELCEQHGLQPTVFYRRRKDHFENGVAALERPLVLSLAKMQDSIQEGVFE